MAMKLPPDHEDLSDQWVQLAAQDREAFGQLFDFFYPQIFAYCLRRLLVRAVAEDVASEVFLKVAKAIAKFQGSTTEDFRRWLFRIATNEINAQLRQSISRKAIFEAAVEMGAVGHAFCSEVLQSESTFDWSLIYQSIGELSEREQSIVSLRFFGQQTHEDIANILKINSGAVRVALSRALDKLRDRLRDSSGDQPNVKPVSINDGVG